MKSKSITNIQLSFDSPSYRWCFNISSTDDPLLWNQSFGFEEALISCSDEALMRPDESKRENRPVKQADGNFTRCVIKTGRKCALRLNYLPILLNS